MIKFILNGRKTIVFDSLTDALEFVKTGLQIGDRFIIVDERDGTLAKGKIEKDWYEN